jgi:hypothetical protein
VPALVPVLMHDFDLGNAAEAIALLKPNDSPTNAFILVDRVRYNDQGLWPHEADGNGPSLERLSASAYGNEPRNWRTTLAGGSPGRRNEFDRITAIARGSKWKINSLGRNLGQAWRGTNYSDSGWASGDAPIGSGYLSLRSSLTNRPVTTYFRKAFVVFDEQAQTTNFILSVNYDDGFVAYLNGHEVARRGLAAGEASFSSFASDHAGGAYENVDLTAFRGWIHQGVNTLAIEVHQSSVSDHDLVWDAELSYVRVDQSAPRPAFTVITLKNSTEALLRWTSVSGRAYRLYASGNLQSWIPLEPAITATNNLTQIIVTRTNAASQFFRVSLEP